MAFKLTKEEKQSRDEHDEKLRTAHETVVASIKAYNEAREKLWQDISDAATAFDEAHDVGSRLSDEFSDKSEKWQESDRGQEVQNFFGEYENFSLETLDLEDPGDINEPDAPSESFFEGLPEEVNG